MKDFTIVNNSLVNTARLLALHYKPERAEGSFRSAEHYMAIFDTGEKLWLSPSDGAAIVRQYQDLDCKPADGMIATTSEVAI